MAKSNLFFDLYRILKRFSGPIRETPIKKTCRTESSQQVKCINITNIDSEASIATYKNETLYIDATEEVQYALPGGWRSGGDYPRPDEISLNNWRWEFLRQNHEYRCDFAKNDDDFDKKGKEDFFRRKYGIKNVLDPNCSSRYLRYSETFGSDGIVPADAEVEFLDDPTSPHHAESGEPDGAERPLLSVRIDLRRPLGPQLRLLKGLAAGAQKAWNQGRPVIRRPHRRKWPLYLRVLDARDAGASYGDIAAALLSGRRRTAEAARDLVRQAEALRNNWPF